MNSGAVLDVAVTLVGRQSTFMEQPGNSHVQIDAIPSTLKNRVTGVELAGIGSAQHENELLEVFFLLPLATTIDGPVPTCEGPNPRPDYVLNASLVQGAEFHGSLKLKCFFSAGPTFETQTIVLKRL